MACIKQIFKIIETYTINILSILTLSYTNALNKKYNKQ